MCHQSKEPVTLIRIGRGTSETGQTICLFAFELGYARLIIEVFLVAFMIPEARALSSRARGFCVDLVSRREAIGDARKRTPPILRAESTGNWSKFGCDGERCGRTFRQQQWHSS